MFTIMEAWTLRPDKMRQMNAILDKSGSISASPYAIDTCALTLETRHGLWAAQPQIKPKSISKKKRTMGVIEFRYLTEVEGRFARLLPKKEGRRATINFALRDAIGQTTTERSTEEFDGVAAGIAEAVLSA